jgi:hypothetical protein
MARFPYKVNKIQFKNENRAKILCSTIVECKETCLRYAMKRSKTQLECLNLPSRALFQPLD